ncbi:MAG: flagellar basal-body rod protein FlgG [Rhodospirillaceae bacterium]|jgi:flagellar basal-body rod protein FlgG|nr:flagellar basal-body rod protein FlgG [Rhodospirillaceae bacterium]MBT5298875.1 flagellar basal-body rod protein FlgG [Rhodospirillaceae bacterium]MBT5515667.1 flagellar basal-body rod protein FlgG [Rhodospirillaceae bacterium]MBT6085674.1 flagellar basal-body rod protein FlgG [Rhodospirillaceae bacterium]MBT6883907.1 flagellar basal-body rod protein FlgG [Rhodospirillaceae bacterium]
MRSLDIAATGMLAQQRNVEVVSNNLANMNTTAFQRRRTEFHDLIYQDLRRVGTTSSDSGTIVPTGVQLGLGVKLAAVYRIHEQGNLEATDNTLDLAIQGKGFFQVLLPDGTTAYSRDGTFQLNGTGQIVTHDGYTVQPGITVPSTAIDVTVNNSGQVQIKIEGQTALTTAGQLQIATFLNDAGLEAIGDNLYRETPASGTATTGNPASTGFGTILQGFLETSNVNAVEEISNLISAQRAYEMNSKVIQTSDEMLGTLTGLR